MNLFSISSVVIALAAGAASAQTTSLRIQTHYAADSASGKLTAQLIDDVSVMSGGDISIEMFYSSSVVDTTETFDAAASGILDCDMVGAIYLSGKNPGFQFVSDIMGGYQMPYQFQSWFYYGGGKEVGENKLYNDYNMHLVGWFNLGYESLISSSPLTGIEDLKGWKFRSPPGLATEVFTSLGASPVVMDFSEVFTALETRIIDGADASQLVTNRGMGLYDLVKHTVYPGVHSMPSDHLACNKAVWDAMPEAHQRIIEVAAQKMAFQSALTFERENAIAAEELRQQGVEVHNWSAEDRASFSSAAQEQWKKIADKSPEANDLYTSHITYLQALGLAAK